MVLNVHRNYDKDLLGTSREAPDSHLHFHTAPELSAGPVNMVLIHRNYDKAY